MDYTKPAYIGASALAGLYLSNYLQGTSVSLSLAQMATVAAIGAASGVAAPMLTGSLVCSHSPAAPVVEAAASGGVGYAAVYLLYGGGSQAAMFLPVQAGAHLVGTWLTRRHYAMYAPQPEEEMMG